MYGQIKAITAIEEDGGTGINAYCLPTWLEDRKTLCDAASMSRDKSCFFWNKCKINDNPYQAALEAKRDLVNIMLLIEQNLQTWTPAYDPVTNPRPTEPWNGNPEDMRQLYLADIHIPTLFLAGENDKICPEEIASDMCDDMGNWCVDFKVREGGHGAWKKGPLDNSYFTQDVIPDLKSHASNFTKVYPEVKFATRFNHPADFATFQCGNGKVQAGVRIYDNTANYKEFLSSLDGDEYDSSYTHGMAI